MAIDSLKGRHYVVKKENKCFCSKCGKQVANDSYLIDRHQKECNVIFEDKYKAHSEKELYGYAFKIENENLVFNVYQLLLQESNGVRNKYSGAKWTVVFKALFDTKKKKLLEKGLYNIDVWFKMLLEKTNSCCLNVNNPEDIIKSAFKSIPYVYSYGMFLDIYRQRGYKYNDINIEKINALEDKHKEYRCGSQPIIDVYDVVIDDEVILDFKIYCHKERYRLFISKDFYYTNDKFDFNEIFGLKGIVSTDRYGRKNIQKQTPKYEIGDIFNFIKKYPEVMVEQYLNGGGTNLFQIVMSPNYNKVIENLSKSGLGYIAEHTDLLYVKNQYGNNTKETFGLKPNVLKIFNNADNIEFLQADNIVEFIDKICEIQPAILKLNLTSSALRFLYHNLMNIKGYYHYKIDGFENFNNDDIFKATKMFCNENVDIYLYNDYLRMCKELDAYPYGKIPKNLFEAHEYVCEIYEYNRDRLLNEQFIRAVTKKEYLLLDSTAYINEEDNEIHYKKNKEDYRIIVPKKQHDLTRESEHLNHCVRTYIKAVADQRTHILFLRKADALDKPFATIEVDNNDTLVQLKAINNTKAPKDAQEFVREWAKNKKIRIRSYDFN